MTESKYRIQAITVEGFRGFTSPQTISFEGKNAFIFGQNGEGKSSVIEAIRWCLFGSPAGRDIEVRNTFYEPSECNVELDLVRNGASLHFRRELRPGATRSRQTIKTGSGDIVLERDALPQLARIGHQQGTQVIFSAQQAVGRQSQIDVTDFTRVLCFYLNLEVVPDLIDEMKKRAEEQSARSDQMASDLEKAESFFRDQLRALEARLAGLLDNPPWGDMAIPTATMTSSKIQAYVGDLARLYGKEYVEPPNKQALDLARQWLNEAHEKSGLESRAGALRQKVDAAQKVIAKLVRIADERRQRDEERQQYELQYSELLGGRSFGVLRDEFSKIQSELAGATATCDLLERAVALFSKWPNRVCPICGTEQEHGKMMDRIKRAQDEITQKFPDAVLVDRLKDVVHELESLTIRLDQLQKDIDELSGQEANTIKELLKLFDIAERPTNSFEQLLDTAKADLMNILRELDDAKSERERHMKALRDLDAELLFHEYRDKVAQLRWQLEIGFGEVRERLKDYRDVLATMRQLIEIIEGCFNDVLDRAIPPLDTMLTDVYQRLTGQMSYDQVRVVPLPESRSLRELRVATSRISGQTFPVNVLNGQAAKAIQLVPYFVFSRFQPDIMELDLLLIDDPSESFDTSHVERLVQILAEGAKHAQLIVATHEKEKFEPQLQKWFEVDAIKTILVKGFDPIGGPRFAS